MRKHQEHGQSLVLVALLMIGMLAFLGLVLDGGYAFVTRRRGQDAADAAALAGVRMLVLQKSESVISGTITTFALANRTESIADVTASYIDSNGNNIARIPNGSVPSVATGIRVTTTLRFQPFFLSLLIGNNRIPIQSVAAAQGGMPTAGALLAPMTLACDYNPSNPGACPLVPGVSYALQGDYQLPGGFQWVDWSGGASANDIVKYLTLEWKGPKVMADKQNLYIDPATPRPNPSPWIPSGPGVQPNNNIRDALDCWLDLDKPGCWLPPGGPKPADRTWLVPVYNAQSGTGNTAEYHVVMFAAFELEGYWFANNQCNWVGKLPSQKCNQMSDLPPVLATCATTQDPDEPPGTKSKCIMGRFLKEAENLETIPGKCNTIGIEICGVGLSQ